MNKVFTLWLLLACYTFAIDVNYFARRWNIDLAKDEMQYLLIDDNGVLKRLKFRWTLFVNEGLVILLNYNSFPTQYILYQKYNVDTIRVDLTSKEKRLARNKPYLLIQFSEFNFNTKKANFDILFRDSKANINIEMIGK
jgi:hypothetical protein